MRLRTQLVATVVAFAVCPAAAHAASTPFGADLSQAPAQGCSTTAGAECSYVTRDPRAGASTAAAPQTGLVTRVRLRTDGRAATYRVRVLAGSALMVSTLDEISVHVGPGPRTTAVDLGRAALPILAGRRLGVGVTVPAAGADPRFRSGPGGGATCERRGPDNGLALMSGLGSETYSSAGCQGEALVAASVEFDQDNDGLGDQTQDTDRDEDGSPTTTTTAPASRTPSRSPRPASRWASRARPTPTTTRARAPATSAAATAARTTARASRTRAGSTTIVTAKATPATATTTTTAPPTPATTAR